MIERARHVERIEGLLGRHPVVAILGPRQVGKTTLARLLADRSRRRVARFDLENPRDLASLSQPTLALEDLTGLVVLDEIQRRPELFPVLRVLVDRPRSRARFLILGSASPDLLRQSSESLAGRIAYYELKGFALDEVGAEHARRLWMRGGLPRSFLARTEAASFEWRAEFVRAFLERDLPTLGIQIPATTLRRFWTMLAHAHGQLWNASEFGRSFGVADTTVRRYLDVLTATFVVRTLSPWHANIGKRQVKTPKVYLADSGLLHALLDIRAFRDLTGHPKRGASWEGFAMGEVVARLGAKPEECYLWRTHTGAELDLLVVRGRERLGFEFKLMEAPAVTPSMRSALRDLRLDSLCVIHAGDRTFPLDKKVRAIALARIEEDLAPLV